MINPDSETWRTVRAELMVIDARLLERLAQPTLDRDRTQYARGQLAAVREILALPNAQKPPELTAIEDYFV